jgi:hypothetical protein
MKALAIIAAVLLVLAHPEAAAAVVAAELAALGGISVLIIRAARAWCVPGRAT